MWCPGRDGQSPECAARRTLSSTYGKRRRGSPFRSSRSTRAASLPSRLLWHSSNQGATTGTPVAKSAAALMTNVHPHIAAARERVARIRRAHPDAFLAAVVFAATVTLIVFAGSMWLAYDVVHDLPTASQLRDVESMAQATTLF